MLEPDLWTVKKAPGAILEEIVKAAPVPVTGERG
jgi:hypothetical protein